MLVLLLVIIGQAVVTMVTSGGPTTCLTASGPRGGRRQQEEEEPDRSPASVPTVDPKLFTKRRYRSPLVRFSDQPPNTDPSGRPGPGARARAKRRAAQPQHETRGLLNVCESVSFWVGDKTKATDIKGNEVTVLPEVKINNVIKKQFFFETTCHTEQPEGSSCRGIDARHWNSYCTNSHTFVRAMTTYQNLVGWRHIRINVACECVLSRKSWRH